MRYILAALLGLVCATGAHAEEQVRHQLGRGDNLHRMAHIWNTTVEDILLANPTLLPRALAACARLSDELKNSPGWTTHYCNTRKEGRYTVGANSVQRGWWVYKPVVTAPADVVSTIEALQGRRIALVVDATGSMNGNIGRVADQYRAAIMQHGKNLIGIWLFADGRVWTVENENFLTNYKPGGSFENTHAALMTAQAARPDAIVLITDEPGDDWPAHRRLGITVPVVAHCLPENGGNAYTCAGTLKYLVASVPGSRYIEGGERVPTARQAPVASATKQLVPGSGQVPPVRRVSPSDDWRARTFGR